jgi:hypothetical protein
MGALSAFLAILFSPAAAPPATAATHALSVYPDNPHYFRSPEGHPVLLIGDYTFGTFSDTDYDFRAMFDTLRAKGLNFARVWVFWGCQYFPPFIDLLNMIPYLRPGPGLANDGKPKYDLTRFDPAFFDRLHAVCAAARERGIFLQLTLFDAWMIKHPELWRLHAFCRDNNINGVDGDPAKTGEGTDDHQGFCSLGNPTCLRFQEALVRHIVDALADCDNILFEIANENYYNDDWELHLCKFIHDLEAAKPLRHLVMPLDLPHHDYGGIKTYDLPDLAANLLKARGPNVPLIFDTDGAGSPEDAVVRKAAWTAVCNGGNVDFLDDSLQPGTEWKGDVQGSRRRDLRAQLGHLAAFTRQFRFWQTQPAPQKLLSGTASVLASPSEIAAYLPSGGAITLDATDLPGSFTARWFDPRTGRFGDTFRLTGGDRLTATATDGQDWTLLMAR